MNGYAHNKTAYYSGKLSKDAYIQYMNTLYRESLFSLSEFIGNTAIKEIRIDSDGICMTTSKGIILGCDKDDARIIPIEMLNFGDYEKEETDMVLSLLDAIRGGLVLDIGANIGWYSLNIAKQFPNRDIIAFEPIEQTYNKLKANVQANGLSNIILYNSGLSNFDGKVPFAYDKTLSGASHIVSDKESTMFLPVSRLDSLMFDPVCFIKCDVEGVEKLVIEGGLETIKRDKPILFLEILRKWTQRFGYHPNDLISLLASIGYVCYTIADSKLVPFGEVTDDTTETNYIFIHKENPWFM